MSPLVDFLLVISLSLNGIWIATRIIRWAGDNSTWLVRVTFGLLSLVVLLHISTLVFSLHSEAFAIERALDAIAFSASLSCCWRLMELLPRPWGNAPRKRKAS